MTSRLGRYQLAGYETCSRKALVSNLPYHLHVELACFPRACVDFLMTLQFPPTDQKHAAQVDW